MPHVDFFFPALLFLHTFPGFSVGVGIEKIILTAVLTFLS